MSVVSEKAIYTGWIAVGDGEKVSIIDKQYTDLNTSDFKTYSTDDSKFRNGTLISKDLSIPGGGYGGIVEYKVKLDSGEVITFRTSPREYYFKVVAKSSGGKKSRRKRNSKKSRKNRRKSIRRRHN